MEVTNTQRALETACSESTKKNGVCQSGWNVGAKRRWDIRLKTQARIQPVAAVDNWGSPLRTALENILLMKDVLLAFTFFSFPDITRPPSQASLRTWTNHFNLLQ